nr:MAG TPA: tail protein [Caudoviricetes sp.]
MENIRIAVLSANDELHTFMDNEAPEALHYYEDELHEYLQGAANTFAFTAMAKHQDSIYLVEGNKLAFVCNGRDYYLNIMSVSRDEYEVEVEALSTSFELLNESVGEYDPGKAVSFESYLNTFDPEHSLSLGINEVSELNVWHKFTGQETILKRLYSVADMFLAELEFVPELNADHSLKRTVLNVYREHSDKNQGVGKDRTDIKLRYGVNVNGIRKTTDITDLATAIRPTGADGLNLLGFESTRKDEKGNIEFQTVKNSYDIWAVQARDRFPSNRVSYDRYIVQTKDYEEHDVNSLFLTALNDLKKMCVPKVTYEVDGYFDTGIGDTVMIEDDGYNPTLYLQARVSEQVRSFTEPSRNKTIFSNFKELQSQVDTSLLDKMNALIQENKTYNCMILSDNGIVFKNGEGTTTLTASVTAPGADLTDKFAIIWKKDGSEIAREKSIVVSAADIVGKAVYRFEAMEGEKPRGSYEVTVSNVDDGDPGSPGESYYTWVKYADDLHGAGMADIPNGKYYIGLAFNKKSSAASNNPQDYQWSKYKGDNGESGIVVSAIPPDNPQVGQLWQTESGQPIMRWDGVRWVLHYIAVENLNVKKLSAITSDLGTVNAGEINGVTIKGTRITGSSLIELQNKTKDGGLMWVKGNSEGLEVIKFSSTGTRVAGVRITGEDIFVDGATRSFKGLNSDMNKTLQEPKLLVGGKTLAQGGSFVASGVRGLLLLEVANSSARSRKMEVFIKGINAERNIHISYADGTSLNITIAVTWSGSNATIKCTRFWAEGQWSGGTSQIYYAYTI